MKIFIATETKVYKVNERLYTSNSFHKVLERYHNAFMNITLCTRISSIKMEELPKSYEDATDSIENTLELNNLKEVALGKRDHEIRRGVQECKLVVARVPSIVAYKAAFIGKKMGIPYLVEVVGCTWDSYWNYNWKSKPLAAPSYIIMRKVVKNADYASYVTEHFLQNRYPCKCESINASNVIIDCSEEGVLEKRLKKIKQREDSKIVLFTAAAIDVAYKGQEYVIRAIKILKGEGIDVEYRLAGNGDPGRLKDIAKECDVLDKVVFLGSLPRSGVMSELDDCDIYIQPSLQEGLPRSVIEAMSRGCPALGANTAGIPELIAKECVFKRANPSDTARAIEMLAKSDMTRYAKTNYQKAMEYDNAVLERRRNAYYQKIISELG